MKTDTGQGGADDRRALRCACRVEAPRMNPAPPSRDRARGLRAYHQRGHPGSDAAGDSRERTVGRGASDWQCAFFGDRGDESTQSRLGDAVRHVQGGWGRGGGEVIDPGLTTTS